MTEEKRKKRNDIILAVMVIILAAAALTVYKLTQTEGDYAVVSVDGVETARYPLAENIETVIYTGTDNADTNTLVIRDGKATVIEANCPDKVCVSHRAICNVGETIVCLPHKLVVSIEAAEWNSTPEIDIGA